MKNTTPFNLLVKISEFVDSVEQFNYFFNNNEITNTDEIIDKRAELREKIEKIKIISDSTYGVQTSYIIIFSLTVYADELISQFVISHEIRWPKYQKEIFNTENGGEEFFKNLDLTLNNPIYPMAVYQIFMLILKSTFQGKLLDGTEAKTKSYYINELSKILGKGIKNIQEKEKNTLASDSECSLFNFSNCFRKHFYIPSIILICAAYLISLATYLWI